MERKTLERFLEEHYDTTYVSIKLAMQAYADQEIELAVRTALSTALDNAWLLYHCGTTKANTHGHKQINIGADNIKIDHVSILSLEQEIISKLKNEKG